MKLLSRCMLLSLLLSWGSMAVAAHEIEREKLSETINRALDTLYSDECRGASKEYKMTRVREVLEKYYDLDVIIRRTIGRNWRSFDSEQKDEVLELVKKIVVKAYVTGMDGRSRPVVTFDDVTVVSDKRIEVSSEVTFDGAPVTVIYRLGLLKSGWQLYDLVVEGVSVVSNYRQQIDDHFRRGNAANLISKLQELHQKEDIDEASTI